MNKTSQKSDSTAHLNVCIIVPTYNEAGNIKNLLDLVFMQQHIYGKQYNATLNVLVVDDNSPDGTAKIVQQYQKKNAHLHLLSRSEKNGLGAAYIAGMEHALNTLKPDVIYEMDADLSHNPADIFRLLNGIRAGADFVIGSRYVPGGSIPDDWGVHRKLISSSANLLTRVVLTMGDVQDCTGGYRAMRASALRNIDLHSLSVKGYAFQISLLDAFIRQGYEVAEVPIAFTDRNVGTSKMRIKDITEFGTTVLKLRAQRLFGKPAYKKYEQAPVKASTRV